MFRGRFVLEQRLGRGAMGEVWLARDTELGELRALKFLPVEIAADEAALARLRREAKAGRELVHPRIVRTDEFYVDEGEAAVAMEYVRGKSLGTLQAEAACGYLEVDEIGNWVVDVCEALDYAHREKGRVHRDIKPQNIMVEESTGRARLMDFGISRRIAETHTQLTGSDAGGTPAYASPQQIAGERGGPTDDLYSLGATIYELLTGTPPFFRGDLMEQVIGKVPEPMAQRRANNQAEGFVDGVGKAIPPAWERGVARCLAKAGGDRPASGRELLGDLGLAAAGATRGTAINVPPVSQGRAGAPAGMGAARWPKVALSGRRDWRRPWVLAGYVMLCLGIVFGGGFWVLKIRRSMHQSELARQTAVRAAEDSLSRVDGLAQAGKLKEARDALAGAERHPSLAARAETLRSQLDGLERTRTQQIEMVRSKARRTCQQADGLRNADRMLAARDAYQEVIDCGVDDGVLIAEARGWVEEIGRMRGTIEMQVPNGASVQIDGRTATVKDGRITGLALGTYRTLKVSLDGFKTVTLDRGIVVEGLAPVRAGNITLERETGQLRFEGRAGTAFTIEQVKSKASTGVDTLDRSRIIAGEQQRFPTGTYRVRATCEGFLADVREDVEVKAGGSSTVKMNLKWPPLDQTFKRSRPFRNTLGMEFVPAGTAGMLMCRWETRRQDFEAFVRETDYDAISDNANGGLAYTFEREGSSAVLKRAGGSWKDPRFPPGSVQDGSHPVVCVSYSDAVVFCEWLTEKERDNLPEGWVYRLPTDEEWSKACGMGTYPWGDHYPPGTLDGNYCSTEAMSGAAAGMTTKDNSLVTAGRRDDWLRTAPVGSTSEHEWGLSDMGGNVAEWCATFYKSSLNSDTVLREFPLLKNDKGGASNRVIRGASWHDSTQMRLRSDVRESQAPGVRVVTLGFRCVVAGAAK